MAPSASRCRAQDCWKWKVPSRGTRFHGNPRAPTLWALSLGLRANAGSDAFTCRAGAGRGAEVPSLLPPPGASRSVPGSGKPRTLVGSVYLQATAREPPWHSYCASCSCAGSRVSWDTPLFPIPCAPSWRPPGNNGEWGEGAAQFGGSCCSGGGWAPVHRGDLQGPRAPAG